LKGHDVSIYAPCGANSEEVTPLSNKFYPPQGGGFKPALGFDENDEERIWATDAAGQPADFLKTSASPAPLGPIGGIACGIST
jgi:hypothetical protein